LDYGKLIYVLIPNTQKEICIIRKITLTPLSKYIQMRVDFLRGPRFVPEYILISCSVDDGGSGGYPAPVTENA
jgi:hypothetical protein